jgi:hypothetical protein
LLANYGSVHDASAGGEDVFVETFTTYVPQDPDGYADIYDVKVDGGFPAPSQASCSGEECQGELNGSLSFSSPGSTGAPAVGNAPPPAEVKVPVKPAGPKALTRAQRLANALKACGKEARKKRAGCERKARERYGAKAKSKLKTKGKAKTEGKGKKSSGKGGK